MTLAIIIPFHDGVQYLDDCLASIYRASIPVEWKIFVVFNDDPKNYPSTLKTSTQLEILKFNKPMGYGRACNYGVEKAIAQNYSHLLLLNQDTLLDKDMLLHLCKSVKHSSLKDVLSPLVFDYSFEKIHPLTLHPNLSSNTEIWTDLYYQKMKRQYPLQILGAVCILINTALVKEIGLFDPVFYLYGEDYDFFKRVKANGGTLWLIPRAKLAHYSSYNMSAAEFDHKRQRHYRNAKLTRSIRNDSVSTFLKDILKQYFYFFRKLEFRRLANYMKDDLHKWNIYDSIRNRLSAEEVKARIHKEIKEMEKCRY